tara:strand:- start:100 stop:1464 length:1365 start_codon:yes stop_codon:yes gene_type:complete
MSFREHIRILKSDNHISIPLVEKIQDFLTEGALTPAEITKYDWRIDLFIDKLKNNKPFETVDNNHIVLKYDKNLEVAIKSGNSKNISKIPLLTQDGQKIPYSKLLKSQEFGGGTAGSGGGASSTKTGESAQCVYLQTIFNNPRTDFNKDEIKYAYNQVDVDESLEKILDLSQDWVDSSILISKLLYKVLGRRTYKFHRGSDNFVKNVIERAFKNSKDEYFSDINKWNPADIWMVDETKLSNYDFHNVKGLPYLNELLLKAYSSRDIIGVSLKKTSKPKLSQINFRKPYKDIKFTKVSYGKRDYFKSKDGYMFFNGGEVQFRTFPAFQGEIIGKEAKHGKISGDGGPNGPIGIVMKQSGAEPIPARKDITKMIRGDRDNFFKLFHNEYIKATRSNMPIEQFTKNYDKKDTNYIESKYLVTLMFNNLKGREQKFLNLAFRYAKSMSPTSSVHLKVY